MMVKNCWAGFLSTFPTRSWAAIILVLFGALIPGAVVGSEVVYDNLRNEFNNMVTFRSNEYGDEVVLSGTARVVTEFECQYYADFTPTGAEGAIVRFYEGDGWYVSPYGRIPAPDKLLYQSAFIKVQTGFNVLSLRGLSVRVPDQFTWTVQWVGFAQTAGNLAGLSHFDPPVIGASYDDFWTKIDNNWEPANFGGMPPANFAARVIASTEIPAPLSNLTTNAIKLGSLVTPGDARGFWLEGRRMYLADDTAGIQILDVNDPTNLIRLGGYDTIGEAQKVTLLNPVAFVSDGSGGMQILDVSLPASPSVLGGFNTPGLTEDIQLVGNTVFLADKSMGLLVFDTSRYADPPFLGLYDTPGLALAIQVIGSKAYVADDYAGLLILDISNPSNITKLGSYRTPGRAFGVQVVNQRAYVADYDAGLQILDVSNPAQIIRLGGVDTPGHAEHVQIINNSAYISDGDGGLQVYDISQPDHGIRLAGFATAGWTHASKTVCQVTYVADGPGGVQILQMSGANQPPTISSLSEVAIPEDGATDWLTFQVSDPDCTNSVITVTASSDNPALVTAEGLMLGRTGQNRTLRIVPAPNASGSALISVTASDGGATTTQSFRLTVSPVNDPPTIATLADQTTLENSSLGPLGITLADIDNALLSLVVTAVSDNSILVPPAGFSFGGEGASRTLTVAPALNQSGSARITVTVSDGQTSASKSFLLTVQHLNQPPSITGLADQTILEDSAAGPLEFTVGDVDNAVDSLAVSATADNPTLIPPGAFLFGGTGASRTLRIMPTADQTGSARVTVTVTDGSLSSSQAFQVVVQPANDPPQILGLTDLNTLEDVPLGPVPFTVLDVESSAAALQVNAFSDNPQLLPSGALVLAGQGSSHELTINPAANQNGLAHITVTVSDGEATTQRTILLTVSAVNDSPTLSGLPALQTITEDGRLTVSFTINDIDSSVDGLVVAATSDNPRLINPAGLQLAGTGGSRTLTLIPVPDQSGTANITLTVSDGILTVQHIFQLAVTSVNDPPVISGLNDYQMEEDGLAFLSFSITDVDTPGGELAINTVSDNAQLFPPGTVAASRNGADWMLTLRPAANQNGTAQITVSAFDGFASTIRSFRVTVQAVNDWPIISGIADQTIQENAQPGPLTFTISDVESPAAALLVTAASDNPQLLPLGALVLAGEGAERTLTVTPAAHQSGSARITVTVSDGDLPASQTFLLTVAPVNDAPVISGLSASQTIPEDGRLVVTFKVQDIDSPVDSLVIVAVGDNPSLLPANSLQVSGTGENRILTITPATDQSGTANITVTVSDGALEDRKMFQLVVTPINDPPAIAGLGDYQMDEDNLGLISFRVTDLDSPASDLSGSASADDSQLFPPGSLVLNKSGGDWVLTMRPPANQNGVARITVIASDGLAVASQTVQVTVKPVNNAPQLIGLADQIMLEDGVLGPLPFTVSDLETPAATLTVVATSDNLRLFPPGSIVMGGQGSDRTLKATPAPDENGTAHITVTVSDGELSSPQVILLTVQPVNDVPIITGLRDISLLSGASGSVDFSVADVDNDPASYRISLTSDNLRLIPETTLMVEWNGTNGAIRIRPTANQTGTARINLSVSDGSLAATQSFMVVVAIENHPPTITGLNNEVTLRPGASQAVVSFLIDDDTQAVNILQLTAVSDNPALLPVGGLLLEGTTGARTLTLTPNGGHAGRARVTLTLSDGIDATTQAFDFIVPANAPRIQVVRPPAGGPVLLKWECSAGVAYRVESSNDLATWVSLGDLSATSGLCEFVDQTAATQLRQFYRVLIR